jgi:hypothetical protein
MVIDAERRTGYFSRFPLWKHRFIPFPRECRMSFFLLFWGLSAALQLLLFFLAFSLGRPRFHARPLSASPFERRPEPLSASSSAPSAGPSSEPSSEKEAQKEAEEPPPRPVALMIPLAGRDRDMEEALDSLLRQDYPLLRTYLATHGQNDPARELARELAARHSGVRHVEAGPAETCGQKNKNLLACLEVLEADTEIYVFCDAGHRAGPDFVRELVRPILQGRAAFCTGYRRTRLCARGVWATAFHMLNRLMGMLESLPVFTQPWGGATAARAEDFRSLAVPELWGRTVVDDCSLAGLLRKHRRRALYRPTALLDSPARVMSRAALDSWFFRQLAYPKFYTFGPWLLIGAGLLWFALVLIPAFRFTACALTGAGATEAGGTALSPWIGPAAGVYLAALLLLQELLRRRIAASCPRSIWLGGLAAALWTTYANYARTILARSLVWRGLRYRLTKDGRVLEVRREECR